MRTVLSLWDGLVVGSQYHYIPRLDLASSARSELETSNSVSVSGAGCAVKPEWWYYWWGSHSIPPNSHQVPGHMKAPLWSPSQM